MNALLRKVLFCLALIPVGLRGQGFPDDSAAARKYRPILDLRVRLESPIIGGRDTLALQYTVTNKSSETVVLCMGKGHGADLTTETDTIRPFVLVDHESCVQRDTLGPGKSVTWRRSLALPELTATGQGTLTPWVDIVDPSDCGPFGCARAIITAHPIKVTITGG